MKYLILLFALAFNVQAALIPASLYGLDDSGDQAFTYTDGNNLLDDSGFELKFEFGQFNSNDHAFGLFQFDIVTQTAIDYLTIFDANDGTGDDSNVVWDFGLQTASTRHGQIDLVADFFGLWFQSDGDIYHSINILNDDAEDHFGLYWNDDQFSDTNLYVYAVDDGSRMNKDFIKVAVNDVAPYGGDLNITAVPEPAPLLLMAMGLLGLAFRRYKA